MKKLLKTVIIEDEPESIDLLHNLITGTGLAEVTASCDDPGKAVPLIVAENPDMVFLDIKMPQKSGFEILDELRKVCVSIPYIVFTTAYDDYAVRAFEYAAFDYLLKPVEPMRLKETIMRCLSHMASGSRQKAGQLLEVYKKLQFRSMSNTIFIDPLKIVFVEADGNYSVLHLTDNKTETVTMLIHKIEEQLPGDIFFRTDRSYIINTTYLNKLIKRRSCCVLNQGGFEYTCNISNERIKALTERMKL